MVGWVASLVVIADSATATEHPHQTFHASLFVLCVFSFCFLCTRPDGVMMIMLRAYLMSFRLSACF